MEDVYAADVAYGQVSHGYKEGVPETTGADSQIIIQYSHERQFSLLFSSLHAIYIELLSGQPKPNSTSSLIITLTALFHTAETINFDCIWELLALHTSGPTWRFAGSASQGWHLASVIPIATKVENH